MTRVGRRVYDSPFDSAARRRRRPDLECLSRELKEFVSRRFVGECSSAGPWRSEGDRDVAWPRLTIVTPSFNQAEYLERTIVSVLNQGYPNLEYMVLDGGSTDGSVEIIRKYASSLAFWCSERDGGQAAAINRGMARATGEWIAFQNSDDIYVPGALHAIAKAIVRNPGIRVVYGDILLIDKEERVFGVTWTVPTTFGLHAYGGQQLHNQATFWRRDVLERLGPLNETYTFAFDYDFFGRILKADIDRLHLPRYVGAFRYHEKTKTSKIAGVAIEERRAILTEHGVRSWGPSGLRAARLVARCVKAVKHLARGELWYVLRRTERP